jgi:hypothetical protein
MPSTLAAPRKRTIQRPTADLHFTPLSRRRPIRLVASALLIVVCGALFAAAYGRAGHQTSVLALARTVPQGAVIVPADVVAVRASLSPNIRTVSSSEAASVMGRTAAVGLIAGSILVSNDIAATSSPPSGDAIVGIALKLGQLPADGLSPGERVDIVLTGAPGSPDLATGASSPDADQSTSPGTVLASFVLVQDVESASDAADADTIAVSVLVDSTIAPLVANASVAGQIALVVVGPG